MGQNEIERYAGAILNDPRFQKLRSFEHHGPANTVYDHSLAVTRAAYRIACALHLSEEETASVVRAALLHDFFGYDWHSERFRRFVRHYSGFRRLTHMHGFIHGHIAAARAKRVFGLSDRECDAIARHMFPLAPIPRSRIAWIVTLADKAVASKEVTLAARRLYRPRVSQSFRMKNPTPVFLNCTASGISFTFWACCFRFLRTSAAPFSGLENRS